MAYFRENEPEETKRQPILSDAAGSPEEEKTEYIESDYDDGFDDGFDDLDEEPEEEELSDEERKQSRSHRFRIASGAWNLAAVIGGTLLILLLLAFLLNMVGFVLNDADRNFTLFQIRF